MTVEIPAYAQLQREMHNALLAQHPEWILPNGDCPTCDSYDARFAELLFQSLPSQPRGLNHGNTHYFNSNPHILTCVSTTHDLYLQ